MRRARFLLDKTRQAHKQYKYGYMPDPRKILPMEFIHPHEVNPTVVRPPHSRVPTHEEFLEKLEVSDKLPTSDFKATFESWNDLMTCSVETMVSRGIPNKTARYIGAEVRKYKAGYVPVVYDRRTEQQFWQQFDSKDGAHVIIPELPEKYRPHQLGEQAQEVPDYQAINQMPEWATKEEERLKGK